MMEIIVYFIAIVLIGLSLTTIINVLIFPQLQISDSFTESHKISILIPARNEEHNIERSVHSIISQTYRNFELIVLNDNSTDATGSILNSIAESDTRIQVLNGKPLPAGWMGKNWACHQLSQNATGEIIIFTDADVIWSPHALRSIVSAMQSNQADLFTVWSTQETRTFAERLTVPLISYAILTYLPVLMTHYSPFPIFAAANGQCMAWKRKAYNKIGGHTVVASHVLDDVTLARLSKKARLHLRMADANTLIHCRMYLHWGEIRAGFAKNILAGYGGRVSALVMSIIFHTVVYILPLFFLIVSVEYRLWSAVFLAQIMVIRILSASFTHQRKRDALLMPLSVILLTIIAIQSIIWHYTGRARWKGRIYNLKSLPERQSHG